MRMKRMVVLVLLVALLVGAFTGCAKEEKPSTPSQEDPKQSEPAGETTDEPGKKIGEGRTLVVGIWGSTQEDIARDTTIPMFKELTGADVELIVGGSTDRYALLYAERDNPSIDVVYLSQAQAEQANADGVIQPPNPEGVPEYNNLYEIAKASGGYGVSILSVGIMYSAVEFPEPPTSWMVLWDEQYKGRVAPMNFPSTEGTAFLVMCALLHGGDENNIDPGFEAIKKLKPFPMILAGVPETNLAFEQGEVVLVPRIDGYANDFISKGGPCGFTIPKEGGILSMNVATIPTNTKNTDLAEIWINLHLGQTVQQAYAERLFYGPTNSTIDLSDELASMVVYGDEAISKLIPLKNDVVIEKQPEWVERWNSEILG